MRILLDTHAFLWWMAGNPRLVQAARRAVAADENDVVVSAASAWEVATKHRLGRLPEADALASDVRAGIASQGFEDLPVSVADAERAGRLAGPVRDPFDRMLIAQALAHDLALVSNERVLTGTASTGCGDPAGGTRRPETVTGVRGRPRGRSRRRTTDTVPGRHQCGALGGVRPTAEAR